jgi:hypothetical protein
MRICGTDNTVAAETAMTDDPAVIPVSIGIAKSHFRLNAVSST